MQLSLALLGLLAAPLTALPNPLPDVDSFGGAKTKINLRIEGPSSTIFEGPITTSPHNVTTPSGGTHKCDGTNNHANPYSGGTITTALDDAVSSWDGEWSTLYDDFFINSIEGFTHGNHKFWGLLVNWQFTTVGGCQHIVEKGDEVLIAYDAFSGGPILKASISDRKAKAGEGVTVTVVNGIDGAPVEGASVGGAKTDKDGKVVVKFEESGVQRLKAEKQGAIRSNEVEVWIVY
jgi:hypothetical protein